MRNWMVRTGALLGLCGLLVGCGIGANGGVAVIDLDAVAKAMGRDKQINEQIEGFAKEQETKLNQLKSELQSQVSAASEKASADEQQSVSGMVLQARNQLQRELGQARQSAQQLRLRLVRDFTLEIQPIAARVAAKKGLQVVMLKQPGILVAAAEVDITADVIAQLQLTGVPTK